MKKQSNQLRKTYSMKPKERIVQQSNFFTLAVAVEQYQYPVTLQVIPTKDLNIFSTDGNCKQFERHVMTVIDRIKRKKIVCAYKCENTTFTMTVSDYPVHVISVDSQCCYETLADVVEFHKERNHEWFVVTRQFTYNDVLYPIGQVLMLPSSQKNLTFNIPFSRKEKNVKCILHPSEKKISLPESLIGNFYPCDRINFVKIARLLSEVVENEQLPFVISFPSQVPDVASLDLVNENILVTDYISKDILIACKQSNDIIEVHTIPSYVNPDVEVLHGEIPVVSLTQHEINIIKSKLIFNDLEKAETEHQRCDLNTLIEKTSNELEEDEIDGCEYTNVEEMFANNGDGMDTTISTKMHDGTPKFMMNTKVMSLKSVEGLTLNSSPESMVTDKADCSKPRHQYNKPLPSIPSSYSVDKNNSSLTKELANHGNYEISSQNVDDFQGDVTNVGERTFKCISGSDEKIANSFNSGKERSLKPKPKPRPDRPLPAPPSTDLDHYEKMQSSSIDACKSPYIHFLNDADIADEKKSQDEVKRNASVEMTHDSKDYVDANTPQTTSRDNKSPVSNLIRKKPPLPKRIHKNNTVPVKQGLSQRCSDEEQNYYQNEWDPSDGYDNEGFEGLTKFRTDSDYDYSYILQQTDNDTDTNVESRISIKQQSSLSKIGSLSVTEVTNLLKVICLDRYCDIFKYHEINGKLLVHMDEEALQSLGLTSFEARKLHQYVNGWRPNHTLSSSENISNYSVVEISNFLKTMKMFSFSNFCLKTDVDGQLIRALLNDELLLNLEKEHKINFKKFQLIKLKQIINGVTKV